MRRKRTRLFLLVAIFVSLGGVVYKVAESMWLMKAAEIKKDPLRLLDYVPEAALEVKDFHRTKVDNGRKVWEVSGEEARYLKAEKEAVVKRPRLVFYNRNGETIQATGDEARLFFADQEIDKVTLEGGIEISYQGFVFHADDILYLSDKNHVVSRGKVKLKGDGLELEGVGMEMDLGSEKIRLLQNVRTRLQPEKLERVRSSGKKQDDA
ncbi:MAG: LPS export ABC transporter periplasmic protein LptC [Candidatus Binatia bacterium]